MQVGLVLLCKGFQRIDTSMNMPGLVATTNSIENNEGWDLMMIRFHIEETRKLAMRDSLEQIDQERNNLHSSPLEYFPFLKKKGEADQAPFRPLPGAASDDGVGLEGEASN